MNDALVAIYLQDHLAAATGGLGLARRARDAQEGRDEELHRFLVRLADEIAEDREVLLRALELIGARPDRAKVLAAAAVERLGRFKPNGHLLSRSPLSDLFEVEGLTVAVQGKLAGWVTFDRLQHPALAPIDFAALIARAEDQSAGIEAHRRPLAVRALSGD